jgi:hypothetical protein
LFLDQSRITGQDGVLPVTYLRAALAGVAAIFIASLGPGLLKAFWEIGQQKATGLGVIYGALLESPLSPQFWILAVLFFCLFFAAGRLSSKLLRVALFWAPTLLVSTVGFAFIALFTYVWILLIKG